MFFWVKPAFFMVKPPCFIGKLMNFHRRQETWMAPSLLDDDLVLGDCDSDDEAMGPSSDPNNSPLNKYIYI